MGPPWTSVTHPYLHAAGARMASEVSTRQAALRPLRNQRLAAEAAAAAADAQRVSAAARLEEVQRRASARQQESRAEAMAHVAAMAGRHKEVTKLEQ